MTTASSDGVRRPRWSLTLGLRTRVAIAFGLVIVTLTGLLAVLTFQLVSSYMVSQRERLSIGQASVNARLVQRTLAGGTSDLDALLTGLGSEAESAILLIDNGRSITSGNLVDAGTFPRTFVTDVQSGTAVHQRLRLNGVPVLAVGFPLSTVGATYVEIFPLRELDRTFRFLSTMLLLGVAVSGGAGALLGRWATSRALRPLKRLTDAAESVAAGDLNVRLPDTDPDLSAIATTFNETAGRLERRVALDSRFAGDVSHELRSPVTTMLNAMAVLRRRRDELSPPARSAVDLLDADLVRFRATVDNLLEISQAHDGPTRTGREMLDLVDVARHAMERAHVALTALDVPDGPVLVSADRRRLERVAANLLENADRHAGGATAVRVRSVATVQGRVARLEVEDAGPGVSPRDRTRIFERFARGEPGDRRTTAEGTGLGLALVADHVRRHDGRVWVEQRDTAGSRFVVELPLDSGGTP